MATKQKLRLQQEQVALFNKLSTNPNYDVYYKPGHEGSIGVILEGITKIVTDNKNHKNKFAVLYSSAGTMHFIVKTTSRNGLYTDNTYLKFTKTETKLFGDIANELGFKIRGIHFDIHDNVFVQDIVDSLIMIHQRIELHRRSMRVSRPSAWLAFRNSIARKERYELVARFRTLRAALVRPKTR